MLYAFGGEFGSGKDEAASAIPGVAYPFGSLVKRECSGFLRRVAIGMKGDEGAELRRHLDKLVDLDQRFGDRWRHKETFAKPISDPMREWLQYWGTDFRRAEDEDYWIKLWEPLVARCKGDYKVPDVRHMNELEAVHRHGGKCALIVRPGLEAAPRREHDSEQLAKRPELFDTVILNDGTTEQLHERVRTWVRSLS